MKVFIVLKRNIISMVICIFIAFLVIFSNNNLPAAKEGLIIWATCIVPSLFPFFIATELLNHTNVISVFGRILNKFMRPIFDLPGESAYAIIIGIISGCPVGSTVVCNLYDNGICTKDEAERLLAFTNNSGPLFIIGTVGFLLFGNTSIGILLFVTHILSALSVGIVYGLASRFNSDSSLKKQKNTTSTRKDTISLSNLGEILTSSISKSLTSIFIICGFIVLTSVALSILERLNVISIFCNLLTYLNIPYNLSNGLFKGIIELTNGVTSICKLNTKTISDNIVLCSFLLGFGGLSIALQVLSIISKSKLSIKKYLKGKLMQGLFAAFYTLLVEKNNLLFNLDIPGSHSAISQNNYILWIILFLLSILIFSVFPTKGPSKKPY